MQERVKGPAIGLIVTGALGLLSVLANIGMLVVQGEMMFQQQEFGDEVPAIFKMLSTPAFTIATTAFGFFVCLFLIFAAMKMKNLESHTMSLFACVLAIIPCWGCCLTGIPFGIWGLVVLMDDEVKESFRS